ncbi:hypothetical protein [Pseudomonas sp. KCJK9058]|uniref:hypothetical protein n=1 Tax=Pseudomonas sp. KCJK9058 TaxID=3344563 RepID=UPI003906C544
MTDALNQTTTLLGLDIGKMLGRITNRVMNFMISKNDLLEEYDSVEVLPEDIYFFQDKMRDYTYSYWLRSSGFQDLIVVCQDELVDQLAIDVIGSVSSNLSLFAPTVLELKGVMANFTHVMVVPPTYHGYLKGIEGIDRSSLFLCLPIYRCEFSGRESVEDFRELRLHYIPVLNWHREKHPKLRVYFDNPRTGGGTDEAGAYFQWSNLLRAIDNINGVSDGFIEITNWSDQVVEVISPSADVYVLIKDRRDEHVLSLDDLIVTIKAFVFA